MIFLTLPVYSEEPVNFPDENLEQTIREAINKPTGDIYPSDLKGLTSLMAMSEDIKDLTGIEYCVNLVKLKLGMVDGTTNHITDLSPLSSLSKLEVLFLTGNKVSDLSPLSGLTNLKKLRLRENHISDIGPLSGLSNLTKLYLGGNNITNIEALSDLTTLTILDLAGNKVTDLSPLSGLTKLKSLNLWGNDITDIQPLVNNDGLGDGDEVYLVKNRLILFTGSEDMQDIQALLNRGVKVKYNPQKGDPIAKLSASPAFNWLNEPITVVKVGQSVNFDASASHDPNGTIKSYLFEFGDGNDSGWISSAKTQHSYSHIGVYDARVKVRDDTKVTKWSDVLEIGVGKEIKFTGKVIKMNRDDQWIEIEVDKVISGPTPHWETIRVGVSDNKVDTFSGIKRNDKVTVYGIYIYSPEMDEKKRCATAIMDKAHYISKIYQVAVKVENNDDDNHKVKVYIDGDLVEQNFRVDSGRISPVGLYELKEESHTFNVKWTDNRKNYENPSKKYIDSYTAIKLKIEPHILPEEKAQMRAKLYEELATAFKDPVYGLYDHLIEIMGREIFKAALDQFIPSLAEIIMGVLTELHQKGVKGIDVNDKLSSEYYNLFEYGCVGLLESGYRDPGNLEKIYADNGYIYYPRTRFPDNISVELDFMRHLAKKEETAWRNGNKQEARELRDVQIDFLKNHLLKWVPFRDSDLKNCTGSFVDRGLDYYSNEGVSNTYEKFYKKSFEELNAFLKKEKAEFSIKVTTPLTVTASYKENSPPDVSNPDRYIGDEEILWAVSLWMRGRKVPGTDNSIDDETMLDLIAYWKNQKPINQTLGKIQSEELQTELESLRNQVKASSFKSVEARVNYPIVELGMLVHASNQCTANNFIRLHLSDLKRKGDTFFAIISDVAYPNRESLICPMLWNPGDYWAETTYNLGKLDSGDYTFKVYSSHLDQPDKLLTQTQFSVRESQEKFEVGKIMNFPNPVRNPHTTFIVEGKGIDSIKVQIFDLAGFKLFDSGWVGNNFEWNLLDKDGELLDNGVYLYVVLVRGVNGEMEKSEVKKLLILR